MWLIPAFVIVGIILCVLAVVLDARRLVRKPGEETERLNVALNRLPCGVECIGVTQDGITPVCGITPDHVMHVWHGPAGQLVQWQSTVRPDVHTNLYMSSSGWPRPVRSGRMTT